MSCSPGGREGPQSPGEERGQGVPAHGGGVPASGCGRGWGEGPCTGPREGGRASGRGPVRGAGGRRFRGGPEPEGCLTEIDVSERAATDLPAQPVPVPDSELHGGTARLAPALPAASWV